MLKPAFVLDLNPYNCFSLIYPDSIYVESDINVSKSFELKRILNKRIIFKNRNKTITT